MRSIRRVTVPRWPKVTPSWSSPAAAAVGRSRLRPPTTWSGNKIAFGARHVATAARTSSASGTWDRFRRASNEKRPPDADEGARGPGLTQQGVNHSGGAGPPSRSIHSAAAACFAEHLKYVAASAMRHARSIASWSASSRFTISGRIVHSCAGHGCIASMGFGFGKSGFGGGAVPQLDSSSADTNTRTRRIRHLRGLNELGRIGKLDPQVVEA